eukprot:COSAG05_NODE_10827_length_544_cov_0.898876_1_plen_60_part_10
MEDSSEIRLWSPYGRQRLWAEVGRLGPGALRSRVESREAANARAGAPGAVGSVAAPQPPL